MNYPDPPKPPPNRIYCDACGFIPDGIHRSIICKLIAAVDKKLKEFKK